MENMKNKKIITGILMSFEQLEKDYEKFNSALKSGKCNFPPPANYLPALNQMRKEHTKYTLCYQESGLIKFVHEKELQQYTHIEDQDTKKVVELRIAIQNLSA